MIDQTLEQFFAERESRFGDPAASIGQRIHSLTSSADPHYRNGIDGARYQGFPDFDRVVSEGGVRWCAWKATQGRRYVDPTFARNRAAIEKAGIRYRPLYHWPTPGNRISDELAHFVSTVGALDLGEAVMIDAEEDGITEQQIYALGDAFEQHYQRPVVVYSGRFVAGGTIINSDRVRALGPFVFAAYTTYARARALAGPRGWDGWQFLGGGGRCPGVNGPVDNDWIPDLGAFDAACGYTATPQPEPENDMRYVLVTLTDSTAKFIATQDGRGRIFDLEWSGPGDDPKVQARLAFFQPEERVELNTGALYLATLHGPLPFGDTAHDWTGEEFFRVVS